MHDPIVYATATATMAAMQRHVSRGACFWVGGTVAAEAAQRLVQRFAERYDLGMTVAQRDHARRQGRATFRLIFWPLAGQTSLAWWLLRTDGEHPLLDMERWRDARRDRIRWPWLYELAQMPVPPALRARYRRAGGKTAINPVTWTWRIDRGEMEAMRASIRHWSQHADDRLRALIRALHLSPGFRQIRDDVHVLDKYVTRQCARRKRTPPPIPPLPRPVIRRAGSSDRKYPLSTLLRRAQRGRATWFPAAAHGADTVPVPPLDEKTDAATPPRETDAPPDDATVAG